MPAVGPGDVFMAPDTICGGTCVKWIAPFPYLYEYLASDFSSGAFYRPLQPVVSRPPVRRRRNLRSQSPSNTRHSRREAHRVGSAARGSPIRVADGWRRGGRWSERPAATEHPGRV